MLLSCSPFSWLTPYPLSLPPTSQPLRVLSHVARSCRISLALRSPLRASSRAPPSKRSCRPPSLVAPRVLACRLAARAPTRIVTPRIACSCTTSSCSGPCTRLLSESDALSFVCVAAPPAVSRSPMAPGNRTSRTSASWRVAPSARPFYMATTLCERSASTVDAALSHRSISSSRPGRAAYTSCAHGAAACVPFLSSSFHSNCRPRNIISSPCRFIHVECHASQKRFLCPFIPAYAASRHSYFPLTMRSTVSAPISTASRLVPLLLRITPLSKYGASSRGRRGDRAAVWL